MAREKWMGKYHVHEREMCVMVVLLGLPRVESLEHCFFPWLFSARSMIIKALCLGVSC